MSLVPDHVAISVPDLAAAREWYAAAFGLEPGPIFSIGATGVSGAVVRHDSGFRIELLHRAEAVAGPMDTSGPDEATLILGYGHLCWRSDEVAATHDRLVELGASPRLAPRPSPNRPGATVCFLNDPWGNLIELLDRPEEQGRHA
jgi:catechol 2,3-dioxygenase-like lactoylglutathione lyase family enzyme